MTLMDTCICDAPELVPAFTPVIYQPHPSLRWSAAPSDLVLVVDAFGSVVSHPLRYDRDSGIVVCWAPVDVLALTGELADDDSTDEFIVDVVGVSVDSHLIGDTLYVVYHARARSLTRVSTVDEWLAAS